MIKILEKVSFKIKQKEKKENSAKYEIEIQVPMEIGWIEGMKFIAENNQGRHAFQLKHQKNENGLAFFTGEIELPTSALYHYYFSFEANQKFIYLKKENKEDTTTIKKEEMWKMSVNFDVPEWAKGKIMYHVFLDRFHRGQQNPMPEMKNREIHSSWEEEIKIGPDKNGIWNADFYGGDLEGIIQKLDYIKSLGVSIIYISPIVWSQSNHRYDTADYEKVDPYAGTNLDLKRLCDKAHEKGMKIILDGVFNHTGNDSKYFNEYNTFEEIGAYRSKDSKYYPFYRKYYNNNQVFFDYWWGMTNLPVCDGTNTEWQQYIYGEGGIIDLWFSLGIDGLRLDVADELSDEFIEGIRKAVKRNKKDSLIIGEVWKNPMRMGRNYIESGKGMDTVMNYPLVDALIRYFKYQDVNKLREVLRQLKTEYPEETLQTLMNFTSTHDITRAINIFGTKEFQYSGEWAWDLNNQDLNWQKNYKMSPEEVKKGKEVLKTYLYTLTFMPGILSIFYGDEAGLEGMGNLANRKPYPWNHQDQELISFYQQLGAIRKKEKFLETANFDIVDLNENYLMFKRKKGREEALITINRTNNKISYNPPKSFQSPDTTYRLKDSNEHELDSHGAFVLKKKC